METKKELSIEVDHILNIIIDNHWSSGDFIDVFDSVSRLYAFQYISYTHYSNYNKMAQELNWHSQRNKLPDFISLTQSYKKSVEEIFNIDSLDDIFYRNLRFEFFGISPIQVNKIKFGSKGSIDLLGIGQLFEIIKDMLIHYLPNKQMNLDNAIKQKEIEEKEQKIIQMKIENLKQLGLNSDEVLSILGYESLHKNRLVELIKYNKIIDIKLNRISK